MKKNVSKKMAISEKIIDHIGEEQLRFFEVDHMIMLLHELQEKYPNQRLFVRIESGYNNINGEVFVYE